MEEGKAKAFSSRGAAGHPSRKTDSETALIEGDL